MTGPVVSLRQISKHFGQLAAVDNVSLDIASGEFVTLLGPSGCGKTTLLRVIAGFETPDSGEVRIGGEDVTGVPPHRRDVHTVFQQYALFPHLTVAGNVAFGLQRKGLSKTETTKRVADALELVQLEGLDDRLPAQLSGGQQQRVAIARAVVLEPRVLLLDEPLGALDRKLREAMQTELKQLQRQLGISFVFVTHDQDEALAMSDRVVVMNAGGIEQMGAPREIYENPETRFIAGFVGVTNVIEGIVQSDANGGAHIEAGKGRIPITEQLTPGSTVAIAVRPEKIRFVEVATDGAIPCTVEDALYLGDVTHWRVRLDDGPEWTIFERNDGTEVDLAPGRRIGLAWDPEHTIHLER